MKWVGGHAGIRKEIHGCSSTLPAKLNEAQSRLAGLLTYASPNPSCLPRNSPSGLNECSILSAYSYGVATDSHRLPEHQTLG